MARSGSWSETWQYDDIIVMSSFDSGEITADDIVRTDCWGTVEMRMARMGSLLSVPMVS
jgi:hypothetical protein